MYFLFTIVLFDTIKYFFSRSSAAFRNFSFATLVVMINYVLMFSKWIIKSFLSLHFYARHQPKFFNLHTYIHNWPLQPFRQDYGLASHTTHVVCVNLIHERRDLQFSVDYEWQIFEKLLHGRFIYSQSFCQKSAERKGCNGQLCMNVCMYFTK